MRMGIGPFAYDRPVTIRGATRSCRALLAVAVLVVTACTVVGSDNASDTSDPGDGITIDAGVFAYSEQDSVSNETFVVTGAPDQAKVATALVAAGNRFMQVDQTGVEHADQAGVEAALDAGLYTPNYVSDPEVTPDGVELYVDCKGSIEEPMAQTFRKILRAELTSAGIRGRVRAVTY